MATQLSFEHQCPQCGAPVLLDETDRLFACPFCRVRSFIHYRQTPRCYFPAMASPEGADLVHVPFWRFRGMGYAVALDQVSWRVLDQSALAIEQALFPRSIGFRPQAMTLKAVQPQTEGSFYAPQLKRKDFIAQLTHGFEQHETEDLSRPLHHAFVGEMVQLIYSPYLADRRRVRDGITGEVLPGIPDPQWRQSAQSAAENSGLLDFLPTLCPHCGWDLEGEKDTLVLVCRNCNRTWHATHRGLQRMPPTAIPSTSTVDLWLPFWSIEATTTDLDLATYGDFIHLTNQTLIPSPERAQEPFRFLVPGFKLNPKLFLHLGGWMTLRQPQAEPLESLPSEALHPVNLPPVEGFQSVLALLANLTVAKKKLLPKLRQARLAFKSYRLVFVPFRSKGIEYIQPEFGFSIPCSALRWGRCL